jgi:hypothetical protein
MLTNKYMPPVCCNQTSRLAFFHRSSPLNVYQVSYAILVICPWNLLALKTTFFLLYLELFGRIRWAQITSWVGIGFVFLSNGIVAIWIMATINPHEYVSWSKFATMISLPLAILGLVADILIFVIPLAAIIPLQMSPAKRMGAMGIFLTGGRFVADYLVVVSRTDKDSAIICSIFNIYYRAELQRSTDNTWDGILSSVFSYV